MTELNLGLFLMPAHPPERSMYDATQWDLEMIKYADELGYSEAWVGEHFTAPWEPIPAPDLLIAQALLQTKQIKLAPGAHILPYHHPVELAHRVAYLDHLAQGRLMLGIGAGGTVTDWELFNLDVKSGENRKMMIEAFELIQKLWSDEETFEFRGEYYSANQPKPKFGGLLKPHIKPLQKPHPPIGVTGLSASSSTLKMAGKHGFIPTSLGFNMDYIASHWEAVSEAAKEAGRTPDRKDWRIAQNVFVAKTDEEALERTLHGWMGEYFDKYWLPHFKDLGHIKHLKPDPNVSDEEFTVEYMIKECCFVGSPETVTRKLQKFYDAVGGFGTLLITGYDYSENPGHWKESMHLLKNEVLPNLNTEDMTVSS
ncbi:LLM class flavin-dependent oxidoreductase [Priestia megaterium]|uniref:LLM class flavin-dependent oxidoreductase n=1 Tax=Priestia megaterium TaxID=1404 RepID=UPI003A8071CB